MPCSRTQHGLTRFMNYVKSRGPITVTRIYTVVFKVYQISDEKLYFFISKFLLKTFIVGTNKLCF